MIRLLRLGVGVAVLLGVLVLPIALVASGLVPHPALASSGSSRAVAGSDDGGNVPINLILAGIWIGWALFVTSLILEVVAAKSRRPAVTLLGLGGLQSVIARLVFFVSGPGMERHVRRAKDPVDPG